MLSFIGNTMASLLVILALLHGIILCVNEIYIQHKLNSHTFIAGIQT